MFKAIDVCPCCGFDDERFEGEVKKAHISCLRCNLVMVSDLETINATDQARVQIINRLIDTWNSNGRIKNTNQYESASYNNKPGRSKGRT